MNSKEKETLASNTELAKEVLATQMQNTNVEELDYSLAALKEQDRVKAVQIMKIITHHWIILDKMFMIK